MSSISFEEAQSIYNDAKQMFFDHLAQFDDWEDYKERHLSNPEVRHNKKYPLEVMIRKFRQLVYDEFFAKYEWLSRYSPQYPDKYNTFLTELDYHNHDDPIILETKLKGRKVKLELFNIKEEELFYPNIKIIHCCHSADHSLGMVLKTKDHPNYKDHQLIFYQQPLLTHPGDREYVTYYAAQLGLPFMIGMRLENLAWLLQTNGVPKIGEMGRWCSRVFKLETAETIYRTYFYPFEYQYTRQELLDYCRNHLPGECKGKSTLSKDELAKFVREQIKKYNITPPSPTRYERTTIQYPLFEWDYRTQQWKLTQESSNIIPFYNMVVKKSSGKKTLYDYRITKKKLSPRNIVQFLGIANYQSKGRSAMNPNITLSILSNKNIKFIIYQYLPIHATPYTKISQLIKESGLRENPYNKEYEQVTTSIEEARTIEVRFGCIWCPYKSGAFYIILRDKFPIAYFFCHLLRLIASARTLFGEKWPEDFGKEYYWYDEAHTPKKHPEWTYIM